MADMEGIMSALRWRFGLDVEDRSAGARREVIVLTPGHPAGEYLICPVMMELPTDAASREAIDAVATAFKIRGWPSGASRQSVALHSAAATVPPTAELNGVQCGATRDPSGSAEAESVRRSDRDGQAGDGGAVMAKVLFKADGNPMGLGMVRADASVIASDFIARVLAAGVSIEDGDVIVNYSVQFALAHAFAALPEQAIEELLRQAQESTESEIGGREVKPWRPPTLPPFRKI